VDDDVPGGLRDRGGEHGEPEAAAAHPLRPRALQRAQRGAIRAVEVGEAALQPSPGHERRPVLGFSTGSLRLRTVPATTVETHCKGYLLLILSEFTRSGRFHAMVEDVAVLLWQCLIKGVRDSIIPIILSATIAQAQLPEKNIKSLRAWKV